MVFQGGRDGYLKFERRCLYETDKLKKNTFYLFTIIDRFSYLLLNRKHIGCILRGIF